MSIDWKLLAEAREDAIVQLEKRLFDAEQVEAELRKELAAIRATTIEECAKICDRTAGVRLVHYPKTYSANPNAAMDAVIAKGHECAKEIRARGDAIVALEKCLSEAKAVEEHMTLAWYDPTNHHVSTNKDDPLFTPLGQLWPLAVKRQWVGLMEGKNNA